MNDISIIVKKSGAASTLNASSGELYLSSPSIVKLQVSRQEISAMSRSGNDLIVTLHSGEKVVLKNFYVEGEQGFSELVLEENDGALWWVKDPAGQYQFESISGLEALAGAESSSTSGWAYVLGALAVAGGAAAIVAHDKDDSDGRSSDHTGPLVISSLWVSSDGTAAGGNAEPGSEIMVMDGAGNELGRAIVDEDGSFTVLLDPPLTDGDEIALVAIDESGNESVPVTTTAPEVTAPANLSVAVDGSAVSGNAKAGNTVTITDTDGNTLGEGTVAEDGSFTIPLDPPIANGDEITVVVTNQDGNSSSPVIPDTAAPEEPTNITVAEDGTSVSGNAEPGSRVTLTDASGNVLGEATAGEDGSFTVPLNPPLTNGETVNVVVTDPAGNSSDPVTAEAPDTTAPAAPTDVEVAEDGTSVSGNAEPGSTVTLTDADGNALGETTVGEDGSFTVPLDPPLTNGETVNVVVTDPAGNSSDPVTAEAPDTTAPAVPTDVEVTADGTSVSGNAEPGSTVTLTDADGNALGEATVGEDGSFTVPLNPPLTNGETVNVVVTDPAGNSSGPVIAEAPDTTAPAVPTNVEVADDGTTVTGNAEPGSTVTLTDANGNALGEATAGADGSFTVSLDPPLTNGETVNVVVTDPAGNSSGPVTAEAPDTTAPAVPTDVEV
ncbi:Ig-like domain-containing protein, partial [Pectobacterium sp. B1J-3]|uniref:Ig-like domain-containing protein n=1 Tax=Pectobacterium sp. B1J-3 TaxID=3385371 RepID=UPI003906A80E